MHDHCSHAIFYHIRISNNRKFLATKAAKRKCVFQFQFTRVKKNDKAFNYGLLCWIIPRRGEKLKQNNTIWKTRIFVLSEFVDKVKAR